MSKIKALSALVLACSLVGAVTSFAHDHAEHERSEAKPSAKMGRKNAEHEKSGASAKMGRKKPAEGMQKREEGGHKHHDHHGNYRRVE